MMRTRLFLVLLPFVVMLLATGIYAILLFSRLATSVDTAVAENYRSVVAAQAMNLELAGMDREAWVAANAHESEATAFSDYQRRFETNLALQLKSVSLPEQTELNRRLSASYDAFRQAHSRLNSAASATLKHQIYDGDVVPRRLELKSSLEKILALNQSAIVATGQRVQSITRDVTRLMVLGIMVALAVCAFASYQLSRWVLRPIQSLTKATQELGAGNLNQPVPVVSRDEVGELAQAFNRMADQLKEYRQGTTEEILRLHRTMETTLATFPDPIFVLNQEGGIELMNPAANDLAAGLRLEGRLPARLQAIAGKCLASGEQFLPHSFNEVVFYRLNGSEKYFLPRILPMRTKEDKLFGVAVVLYDVTRFRLLDAAKTNLVATVSHELKTPLTSVRMALHLLLEKTVGALTPKQDELLQAARGDTERLLRILNDLLDLARLEEGNPELRRENVAPAALLQAAVEETADRAAARGLKLDWAADSDLPEVCVDRQSIGHIFTNLMTNAIKHSPAGAEIRLRASRWDDNSVRFTIADAGPGVPSEYQARIFERFFRVPGQSKPGAGLGLSIAREIAMAHGGRLGVQSAAGKGATFFLVLKAAAPTG